MVDAATHRPRAGTTATLLAAALMVCSLAGCDELREGVVGDDTVEASTPDLRGLLVTCLDELRQARADAGRTFLDEDRVCIIAPFNLGCPLRKCAEDLLAGIAQACPSPDSGLLPNDPEFCEALANPLGSALP